MSSYTTTPQQQQQLLTDGFVSLPGAVPRDLIERWMGLVLRRAHAADWPESWRGDLPSDLGSDEQEIQAIVGHWEPPIPAVYCPHNIETDEYPVPSAKPDAN